MSGPAVLCVMLANGRQEMVNRAVRSYLSQTYQDKRLLILDTGDPLLTMPRMTVADSLSIYVDHSRPNNAETIGALRNRANLWAKSLDCEVIAHWDSDDWSHSNRLSEQVALLQSGDFDAVGYSDMLFWKQRNAPAAPGVCRDIDGNWWHPQGSCEHCDGGEAWLYRHPLPNYALGTSLMYWRRTWEAKPFADLPQAGNDVCEDFVFQSGLRVKSVPSLLTSSLLGPALEPRMIASIHSSNSRKASYDDALRRAEMFTRVPEWDQFCRDKMRLP